MSKCIYLYSQHVVVLLTAGNETHPAVSGWGGSASIPALLYHPPLEERGDGGGTSVT